MSEKKFTPGLWVSVDDGNEVHDRACAFDESGARVGSTPNEIAKVFGLDDEQRSSNANLIAAAPELYEALETTLENIRSLGPAGALYDTYKPWERLVESALRKARGEE